jgi:hypothetical protein
MAPTVIPNIAMDIATNAKYHMVTEDTSEEYLIH